MPIKRDGKTYYTIEETDVMLSEMAKVQAKDFAKQVIRRQKEAQKQYV